MTTTWKPDPEDPTFELGWEGDTPTGERRQAPQLHDLAEGSENQQDRAPEATKITKSKKTKIIVALSLAFVLIAVAGVAVGIALSMKAVEQNATESSLREIAVANLGYDPESPDWPAVGKSMCHTAEGKSTEEFWAFVKPVMMENGLSEKETMWLPLIALVDYCPDEALRLSGESAN